MATRTFVIVGAGLAGAKAAEELRNQGFDGRIVLVGDEFERPYERPPLSKQFLRGEMADEKVFVHPAGFYDAQGIELVTALRALEVDAAERMVRFGTGERLHWWLDADDRVLAAMNVNVWDRGDELEAQVRAQSAFAHGGPLEGTPVR